MKPKKIQEIVPQILDNLKSIKNEFTSILFEISKEGDYYKSDNLDNVYNITKRVQKLNVSLKAFNDNCADLPKNTCIQFNNVTQYLAYLNDSDQIYPNVIENYKILKNSDQSILILFLTKFQLQNSVYHFDKFMHDSQFGVPSIIVRPKVIENCSLPNIMDNYMEHFSYNSQAIIKSTAVGNCRYLQISFRNVCTFLLYVNVTHIEWVKAFKYKQKHESKVCVNAFNKPHQYQLYEKITEYLNCYFEKIIGDLVDMYFRNCIYLVLKYSSLFKIKCNRCQKHVSKNFLLPIVRNHRNYNAFHLECQ
ncbi:hypothetical protein A3Q56_01736 [Intoshia linei]|uniref:Mediator of RNA polymerase II transcription subunit 27 n=1 Tax=Intoshia linei TaxID=1819745 RepID=A0A177BA53_9BILA|nr:hypothetical protein A3Q56_01736 [Intoshia linei]